MSDAEPTATPPREPQFVDRHIGWTAADRDAMLRVVGYASTDALVSTVVPSSILADGPLALPPALSEDQALVALRDRAAANTVMTSLIGAGYSATHTPGVILRNIFENPAWYTAYTPYQPEISQGRLEALINFQTMITDLTGLDLSNASMLDEATAAAEAMAMGLRSTKSASMSFFVDHDCHPQVIEVCRTRAEPLGITIVVGDATDEVDGHDIFGALLAYPGTSGTIRDLRPVTEALTARGVFVAVAADLLALCLLSPPGEWGADAVVGSSQRFGVPLGFGGPHAGFLATRSAHKRNMPGRLVGVSIDTEGRPAYRLSLQTREQHIRRERATSNICTAQVLLAVMASMYAVYHGPDGLRAIATRVARLTFRLATSLRDAGVEVLTEDHFDTVQVRVADSHTVLAAARERGINLRRLDDRTIGISLDETTTPAIVADVLAAFGARHPITDLTTDVTADAIPASLRRTSGFLTHPTFHRHRSETEMLRYLRRLADLDIALDRSMIPLGSCTMKLNATSEMVPVTWPEFGAIHPFAPADQVAGYRRMISELEDWLAEITGYDAVSVQPNAGSQGEYAGLLAIRAYHRSRGHSGRDVCLIPSSAHGTNAASAVMAGMKVVVVACDSDGNVDLDDLRTKVADHSEELAAIMVTYPSTHGVFEDAIGEICGIVHDAGGQVYVDGANLNALVGVARPGRFGADVSHLNLHKTFCIPHGGGGPGVGPIGVRSHLAPFLPSTAHEGTDGDDLGVGGAAVGAVSAAPYGSAGILPISWMYIAMMGPDGLKAASHGAILAANYVSRRLSERYSILYSGADGLVAHECIVDIRPIEKTTGISAEDIAKRLIDYGFHAPTMSFPVAGTLMIEPTESESLGELDRFCDAMIQIADEIAHVADGRWNSDDNPLVRAPHTAEDLLVEDWRRPYSRELAAYPVRAQRSAKYWPPVSRIDGGYGDRNLMCSCPPVSDFVETPAGPTTPTATVLP